MKFIVALLICLGVSGCAEEVYVPANVGSSHSGTVNFCDDVGCRDIPDAQYYYDASGDLYYWDTNFGVWIGSNGYYRSGVFYGGWYPGYHSFYGPGYYGRLGGGYRGGYHGGYNRVVRGGVYSGGVHGTVRGSGATHSGGSRGGSHGGGHR